MAWAIIVHGGAGPIPESRQQVSRSGCVAAAEAGAAIVRSGGSALDAVETAIRILENDPTFNAGYGSVLNAKGEVEMDASIMTGGDLAIGAVGAVQGLRNPISAARLVLPALPILLVGDGACSFAAAQGAETCDPAQMIAPHRAQAVSDTVGAVALDLGGGMAAGLSTGGASGKLPGRIGDVALPGCGFYVDDLIGGTAFSGDGEAIARSLLATEVMVRLQTEGPREAALAAIKRLERVGGEAGAIVLSPTGHFGYAHSSPLFAVAFASDRLGPTAVLHRDEFAGVADH